MSNPGNLNRSGALTAEGHETGDVSLRIYHRLPSALRSIAAAIQGLRLRGWRYDSHTPQRVTDALRRETWSREEWQGWQSLRLAEALDRAATRVPYYRQLWRERRRRGDAAPWTVLENWPVLEKEAVRRDPRAFVADDCDVRRMYHQQTSGTTGTPLTLWASRDTVREWYALGEARWRAWYGVSRHDRWAILGGQLVAPVAQRSPPFWVWNPPMRQLYMSSYHLAPCFVPAYVAALERYRIRYLLGYTSSLYALAREVVRQALPAPPMAVAIANAEPVYAYQRRCISEAFQCPVRETYGMSEMVCAASECEAGRLHLWPEVGAVEVLDGTRPIALGSAGALVCTGLLNADMPLIRYRLGDRGALAEGPVACPCGRRLPVLKSIEGRCDDVLYGENGAAVGRLDPVFKGRLPIREAQIVQEDWRRVTVLYAADADLGARDAAEVVGEIRGRMGDVSVTLARVLEVPRDANGKFRAVISRISKEEAAERLAGPSRPPPGPQA